MEGFDQAVEHLDMLKQAARDVTLFGDFLLSSNELSHFWIHLERLWFSTKAPIRSLMKIFAVNCSASIQRPLTLFTAGHHTHTTEEELQVAGVASDVVDSLNDPDIHFGQLIARRGGIALTPGQPLGEWLGVFAMSVHVDVILHCVRCLRESGREVSTILTIIERGVSPREILRSEGIQRVIPMLVCNESSQQINHVLELDVPPYSDFHCFFTNPKQSPI